MNAVKRTSFLALVPAILLTMLAVSRAQQSSAAQAALSEADLLKLVELQVRDRVILAKVEKVGISFPADADAIERLKKAGTSSSVLAAVRKSGETRSAAAGKAVTYQDLKKLLELGID